MAPYAPSRLGEIQLGFINAAAIDHLRTSVLKGAPLREVEQIRDFPRNRAQVSSGPQLGKTFEEALGIGMLRSPENVGRESVFDNFSGIHDRHFVAEIADSSQIVRNE